MIFTEHPLCKIWYLLFPQHRDMKQTPLWILCRGIVHVPIRLLWAKMADKTRQFPNMWITQNVAVRELVSVSCVCAIVKQHGFICEAASYWNGSKPPRQQWKLGRGSGRLWGRGKRRFRRRNKRGKLLNFNCRCNQKISWCAGQAGFAFKHAVEQYVFLFVFRRSSSILKHTRYLTTTFMALKPFCNR